MYVFINTRHPSFGIYCPAAGTYAKFQFGKLLLEDDDPRLPDVLRHARKDPDMSIIAPEANAEESKEAWPFSCDVCETGFATEDELGDHTAEKHTAKPHLDDEGNASDVLPVKGPAKTTSKGTRRGAASGIPAAAPSTGRRNRTTK